LKPSSMVGNWSGTYSGPDDSGTMTWAINATSGNSAFSGDVTARSNSGGPTVPMPLEGTVEQDNKIAYGMTAVTQGCRFTWTGSGTVSGSKMEGSLVTSFVSGAGCTAAAPATLSLTKQ
jgi:hypothetical protein